MKPNTCDFFLIPCMCLNILVPYHYFWRRYGLATNSDWGDLYNCNIKQIMYHYSQDYVNRYILYQATIFYYLVFSQHASWPIGRLSCDVHVHNCFNPLRLPFHCSPDLYNGIWLLTTQKWFNSSNFQNVYDNFSESSQ